MKSGTVPNTTSHTQRSIHPFRNGPLRAAVSAGALWNSYLLKKSEMEMNHQHAL